MTRLLVLDNEYWAVSTKTGPNDLIQSFGPYVSFFWYFSM